MKAPWQFQSQLGGFEGHHIVLNLSIELVFLDFGLHITHLFPLGKTLQTSSFLFPDHLDSNTFGLFGFTDSYFNLSLSLLI